MIETYLLYTPIVELQGGYKTGGAVRIRTFTVPAYVGFATMELAAQCCDRMQMGADVQIIPASALGTKYPALGEVRHIVRIPDERILKMHLETPKDFHSEDYLESFNGPG